MIPCDPGALGSLCSLYDDVSLALWLEKTFGYSKQRLKKFPLKKNLLQKEVRERDVLSLPLDVLNHLQIGPHYRGPEVAILEDDGDYLALHKPSLCHSHPLTYSDDNNLLSYLRSCGRGRDYLENNCGHYDRGLLYRLDYETSGLILMSRFKREEVSLQAKAYLAVVEGRISEPQKLRHFLSASGKKVKLDPQGARATCLVYPLAYDEHHQQTVITVFLQEGLRHQIRVQLAQERHPIVGDVLYGGSVAPFFGLHCYCYQVEQRRFVDDSIPFPSSLLELLDLDRYFEVFADQFGIF